MIPACDTIRGEVLSTRVLGQEYWGRTSLLLTDGSRVDMVGKILGYQEGDTVEADGRWDDHQRYGRQFKATRVKSVVPADASGAISWLCSYVPHFGRKRATDLVEAYGVPGIWDVIEQTPERLTEIRGLTEQRVAEVVAAYREHRLERDRMVRLRTWGLSDGQIARVLAAWGERTEEMLQSNPYQLDDLHGVGFRTADTIAQRMGLPRTAPARIRAGARHILEQAAVAGHVYVPMGKLVGMTASLLEVTQEDVREHIQDLDRAVRRASHVYLERYDRAESQVAQGIAALVRCAGAPGETTTPGAAGKEKAA